MENYPNNTIVSCSTCMHRLLDQDDTSSSYCIERDCVLLDDWGFHNNCIDWCEAPINTLSSPKAGDGGRRANISGNSAEHVIACLLKERGYTVRTQYVLQKSSIFGTHNKVDIFCQGIPQFRNGLIIESKWQDTSGSAIQKIVYTIQNIKETYPTKTILVIDGKATKSGMGKGGFNWAKNQVDDKLVAVYTMNDFMSWVVRDL